MIDQPDDLPEFAADPEPSSNREVDIPADVNPADSETPESPSQHPATFSNPNVELTKPVDSPLKNPELAPNEHLSLINGGIDDFNHLVHLLPNLDATSGEEGSKWTEVIRAGQQYFQRGNSLFESLNREGSFWRQSVENEAGELAAGRPRFGESGTVLSGEKALIKARAVLGLGALVQIPLWHTGIWVSYKAPGDDALLELERRLAAEKISLGRLTNGMLFSNSSIYINSYLVNFALAHVYDSTLKDISPDNLKKHIKITDIPTLVWGLLCAIYPNGYPYARSCTNTVETGCQATISAMLSLAKLSWTDNRSLSTFQRRLMERRTTKASEEDLKRYQEEHTRGGARAVTVRPDKLAIVLEVPTLEQYEASGFAWVDGISRMLEDSFGVSMKGQERDNYIKDQGRVTALRQYGHWVSELTVGGEKMGDDRDTIESLIGVFSEDSELSDAFFTEVGRYIDDVTISLIALPKHVCPMCGSEQTSVDGTHPYLIPLDVSKLFFTLLDQKISRSLRKSRL